LAALLQDARFNALCLGPGLSADRARELVPIALGFPDGAEGCDDALRRAVVLDADALTAHAETPDDLFAMLHPRCVLTPHMGEFRRLFPDIADQLVAPPNAGPAYSKTDAVRAAAARAGCTVLLKGRDTVIAQQDGTCVVHPALGERAAPWLATAGSGDVLAGFITGLMARGFEPPHAAAAAVWLHVACARHFGAGLIAEDIPEQIPAVLRSLGV